MRSAAATPWSVSTSPSLSVWRRNSTNRDMAPPQARGAKGGRGFGVAGEDVAVGRRTRSTSRRRPSALWAPLTQARRRGPGAVPRRSVRVAQASRRAAEVDVLGLDRPGRPPRRRLVGPVQVRVRDDLVRRRRPPCRLVLRRVRGADTGRVVPPGERAVERRADARVGLCADDDESPDTEVRQYGLEGGVLEGVAVVLLDERLGVARSQFGDDPPVVAPPRKMVVGVLDPDNGDPFPPRLLDQAADVRDDRVAPVISLDGAV